MKFQTKTNLTEGIEINIIPLIDVMLVLLIFFMVSTTFNESDGIRINLPSATKNPVTNQQEQDFTVAIDETGVIFSGNKRLSLEEVSKLFSEKIASNSTNPVKLIVKADLKTNHGRVVAVMDAARTAGIEKIAIATTTTQ